ncbi:hypothetical protein P8452_54371 [Trifolium repens]|jgi:hypothetical protein|nr:hypothetical protein QL285_079032 [Trifolium repens]WJX70241.1 hypothetical protein P8452_54371 [Trifolium repens]
MVKKSCTRVKVDDTSARDGENFRVPVDLELNVKGSKAKIKVRKKTVQVSREKEEKEEKEENEDSDSDGSDDFGDFQ